MTKIKILPLYDKIVVKKIKTETKKNNIFITSNNKNLNRGKVIAIGQGHLSKTGRIIPLLVKINDIVLFYENYNVREEIIDEEEFVFMSESDILAKIEE